MERPKMNEFERWAIANSDTMYAALLKLRFAVMKFKRELWKAMMKIGLN